MKLFVILLVSILFPLLIALPLSYSQHVEQMKQKEELVRNYMMSISRQMGVTCTHCHDTSNYKYDKKKEFVKAREHIKITQSLIDQGIDGVKSSIKADCYLCHRGKIVPEAKEPFNPLVMEKNSYRDRKPANVSEAIPALEEEGQN